MTDEVLKPLNLSNQKGKCRDQDDQNKQMHQYQYPSAEIASYQVVNHGVVFLHFLLYKYKFPDYISYFHKDCKPTNLT